MPVGQIATATDRDKKSIYGALDQKPSGKTVKLGRPPAMTRESIAHVIKTLKMLVKTAAARYEVTLGMIKEKSKCRASETTMRRTLQKRNIKFRRLRSKPILTNTDKRARFAFAKKYHTKSKSWWLKTVHMHIDLKNFSCYVNARARQYAAQREVRGGYRLPGQGLDEAYVVANKALRFNPGVKSAMIAAGVGNGRVRMWHALTNKWSGLAAADLYQGPAKDALKRAWPAKRCFTVLEDNDPTGFKSTAGKKAKVDARIKVFVIPARSPDLNVCDYALWSQVSRVMRRQEKSFPPSKRESPDEFLQRLHRAAKGLSKAFVDKSIGDMARRCKRLYAARGGLFEEGGRPTNV